jgi:outer membrane receptor protein involved in Fe transport
LDIEHRSGFGGQVAYTFISDQYADQANTVDWDETGRAGILPAHHIVDANAHYNHKKSGLSVRLAAKNLTNTLYIAARRPEGIFPGGYRQIMLGLRWTYDQPPPAEQTTTAATAQNALRPHEENP